ncbi:MAG: tRNA (adenosine(37)-N6)-threonylcarbamoyltransferase complex transferase subunit TsaD [Mobiluncus porci]|uniref:tRNA N6-adenosine threonylcarbamoyltransferase n=1 Tax=Mobiluncus porci TaxID=2652278 RepID=A0A7K0K5E3_9ACTO|nr:tRNA (adenosine(37)-N6)-threonylcarbamoyltransferase complex transferase subunit TsaD [Mobiluncus porci]MDD7540860.1 tRNA (adenosine(37)-N6)-threonylcarbamoyltransferase complex transferase subunit TsaD [Mobiluncus porci]MDY5749224.1 tRNA (adenosine(37)-N6)-threonylcarbamoyltransferase complex transferase subunit TsaD [Mobiluncus porci]MST50697.1 tRNA (adenosine(37)-N6)-threonylcarbamoyltransferase complex transferase subunit TsaD [Mobiluncus porci]
MLNGEKLTLGIESTCDETGAALVAGKTRLIANVVATSMDEYARYGGIIPEIASRAHLESFLPVVTSALDQAGAKLEDVDQIGVAAGPGLIGSLAVGIAGAKALATATGKPLYGVNHVIGHLAVDQLVNGTIELPAVGLVVSGGHTNLLLITDFGAPGGIRELGGTLDDASGEAFDKVGRVLGLPYPGGPHVDRLSREGTLHAIDFPRGLAGAKYAKTHPYDFSFSGLKTAVARWVDGLERTPEVRNRPDFTKDFSATKEGKPWLPVAEICKGFSESVNDSLVTKTMQALADTGAKTLVVGGGYSANSRLREWLGKECEANGVTLRIPPLKFCTDNGAQIAAITAAVAEAREPSAPDFSPVSALDLMTVTV